MHNVRALYEHRFSIPRKEVRSQGKEGTTHVAQTTITIYALNSRDDAYPFGFG
jgi:hypothetical protein